MSSQTYKACAVPQCKNTRKKTPNKLFIHVQRKKSIRNKWLRLAGRDPVPDRTMLYFCEDHFDMPKDMVNYYELKLMGRVSQIRMRPGCVPSRFDCQLDHSASSSDTERPHDLKEQRQTIVDQCFKEFDELSLPIIKETQRKPKKVILAPVRVEELLSSLSRASRNNIYTIQYQSDRDLSTSPATQPELPAETTIMKPTSDCNVTLLDHAYAKMDNNDMENTFAKMDNDANGANAEDSEETDTADETDTEQSTTWDETENQLNNDNNIDKQAIIKQENYEIETQVKIEHLKLEPCDFNCDFDNDINTDVDIKEEINHHENDTRNLYHDHIIKEEMVIGPENFPHFTEENSVIFNHSKEETKCSNRGSTKKKATSENVVLRWTCVQCQLHFDHPNLLKRHSWIHEKDRNYFVCSRCPKIYFEQHNLIKHMAVHTDNT